MSSNEMPSRTGVRITGDDYQWLHVWWACMTVIHDHTNPPANPAVAVGVEVSDAGNVDDVVRYRAHPPHEYAQVKYAVDGTTPLNTDYLIDTNILQRLCKAHRTLTANGDPVLIRLVTNRLPDPGDPLLACRDGRDLLLLPRAAQGSPTSEIGRTRARWAAAADCTDAELITFLHDVHFDVGRDLPSVLREVGWLMAANGLRNDEHAIREGIDWVRQQVIAGKRRLNSTDITAAIDGLGLRSEPPWTMLSVATLAPDPHAGAADVSIDWVDRMNGTSPGARVEPAPPHTWDDLAADLNRLHSTLPGRRVQISGTYRQATAFYLGTQLSRVRNYTLSVEQGTQTWTSDTPSTPYLLTVTHTPLGLGPDVAVIASVATDHHDEALNWVQQHNLPIGNLLTISPQTGAGPNAVNTPAAANGLAVAIRDTVRRNQNSAERIHLFIAGPVGAALLLGHHWNKIARTLIYEHVRCDVYAHAFTVGT